MKRSSLFKDFFREVWKTRGRFIAIFAIVAIGCGFFAGVKSTCPDMLLTAEKYFLKQNLMDFHLKSTYGFNEEDIAALKNSGMIKEIKSSYSSDFFVDLNVDADIIIRAYSFQYNNTIDKLVLKEGRFPESENECLAEKNILTDKALSLGNTITLTADEGEDISATLSNNKYTVVGIVESPLYISFDRGISKLGNGDINSFIYIPEKNFKYEYYTDVFLTLNSTASISPFSDEYENLIQQTKEKLQNIANIQQKERFAEIIEEATKKLNDSKSELQSSIDKSNSELLKSRKQLDSAKAQLEKGKLDYVAGIDKFNSEIAYAESQISSSEAELLKAQTEYNNGKSSYDTNLETYKKNLASNTIIINELNDIISDLESVAKKEPSDFTELSAKIQNSTLDTSLKNNLIAIFTNNTNPLPDDAVNQLTIIIDSMKTNAAEIQKGLDDVKTTLDATALTLTESKAKLDAGFAELNKSKDILATNRTTGQKKLDDTFKLLKETEQQISDNEAEYRRGKAKAEEEINNAKIEIANAEKKIKELENPKWYLFDRNDNPGYSGYETDAQRVDKIAAVFPIFFILVAALVCLTTMTRMVEEQRTQIGVLKALGYSKQAITGKYLGYAVLASVLGSAAGLSIGFKLFPLVIFNAYKILYILPEVSSPFRFDYALLCTTAAILCTGASALTACFAELHAVPAELMRPKAPKNGKRVFFERITPLWSRMSFIYKVTIRNIFRYKKRVLMTVVGIAGCTALMLTGFGLRYSISSIIDKQFGEIFHYDLVGAIDEDIDVDASELLKNQLKANEYLESSINVFEKSTVVTYKSASKDISLFIPENSDALKDYITFRNRKNKALIELNDNGVIITEKMAKLLNVKVGNEIKLSGIHDVSVSVKITAITENYTNNYVYITPAYYKSLFGDYPKYNTFLAKMKQDNTDNRKTLSSSLLKNTNILGVSYIDENKDKFFDILKSLDLIVIVLIFSAGSLAFVVLYNLTNINVNERKRELATIKVLGFFDGEVSKYIYRENIISTALGIILGLFIGVPFDRFVISTSEVDAVMFTPGIDLLSFAYAIALTVVFAAIVNIILYWKLKKIDMVESLKSIE